MWTVVSLGFVEVPPALESVPEHDAIDNANATTRSTAPARLVAVVVRDVRTPDIVTPAISDRSALGGWR